MAGHIAFVLCSSSGRTGVGKHCRHDVQSHTCSQSWRWGQGKKRKSSEGRRSHTHLLLPPFPTCPIIPSPSWVCGLRLLGGTQQDALEIWRRRVQKRGNTWSPHGWLLSGPLGTGGNVGLLHYPSAAHHARKALRLGTRGPRAMKSVYLTGGPLSPFLWVNELRQRAITKRVWHLINASYIFKIS